MKHKTINVGTFNIQGGNSKQKKTSLADDMLKYDITALTTTETRILVKEKIDGNTPNN